jgi:hypothetical protein
MGNLDRDLSPCTLVGSAKNGGHAAARNGFVEAVMIE